MRKILTAIIPIFFIILSFAFHTPLQTHYIGEKFGGGIIFHLSPDGKHGLIVTSADVSSGIQWYNGINKLTGVTENNDGLKNTETIIAAQQADNPSGNFAAKLCADLSITVDGKMYDDWYLPSKYELNLLFLNHGKVGNFDDHYYWTSNEVNANEAWIQSFYDGRQLNVSKADGNYVRAIRAF